VTLVGLDDTDSRTEGMCTTYAAALVADALRETGGTVDRLLLVRLNPAVEHKTRGNAALAIHCDVDPDAAFEAAASVVDDLAVSDDPQTNPGVVAADAGGGAAPDWLGETARRAVREVLDPDAVTRELARHGYRHRGWGDGRGLVGATAAVGAWRGLGGDGPGTAGATGPTGTEQSADWTYECISYRERERWGSAREVDEASVFAVADAQYPDIWDTVDRGEGEAVCVPNTPGPVLHGIRGDDRDVVRTAAAAIESEPVARRALFVTNQGTDAHVRDDPPADVTDGRAYRLTGEVVSAPETAAGGHVFVTVALDETAGAGDATGSERRCVAFEPTKRFRDRVRALRPGDRVTVCGEVSDGTLKLEKFAVRDLVRTESATPDCPACGRSMESAGADAGYRCRDCATTAPGKIERPVERVLEPGWYEVPPCARRHVAKPLVRGGFDAPTHPER
jgi:tRNA(Ile2)-agmatinylcytidine synthase